MDYLIVSLKVQGKYEDLKVPAFISVGELIDTFNEIYQCSGETLHADPKGIILDKKKTLIEQGIEHGAKLTLA